MFQPRHPVGGVYYPFVTRRGYFDDSAGKTQARKTDLRDEKGSLGPLARRLGTRDYWGLMDSVSEQHGQPSDEKVFGQVDIDVPVWYPGEKWPMRFESSTAKLLTTVDETFHWHVTVDYDQTAVTDEFALSFLPSSDLFKFFGFVVVDHAYVRYGDAYLDGTEEGIEFDKTNVFTGIRFFDGETQLRVTHFFDYYHRQAREQHLGIDETVLTIRVTPLPYDKESIKTIIRRILSGDSAIVWGEFFRFVRESAAKGEETAMTTVDEVWKQSRLLQYLQDPNLMKDERWITEEREMAKAVRKCLEEMTPAHRQRVQSEIAHLLVDEHYKKYDDAQIEAERDISLELESDYNSYRYP
ncbi:hypothetical protein AAVH_16907 [Aphelenchoides avenae]|nr:hypothetical protein AAVH_16907 [Aphelenchus avenae]